MAFATNGCNKIVKKLKVLELWKLCRQFRNLTHHGQRMTELNAWNNFRNTLQKCEFARTVVVKLWSQQN